MRLIITLLLLIPSLSWGNMISLNQYLSQNPDLKESEMFYVSTRCTAIYYLGADLNKNRPDLQKRLQDSYDASLEIAIMSRKSIFPNEDFSSHMDKAIETTGLLLDKYIEMSNESYINTGSYYTESMWADMEVCRVLVESY